MWPAVATMLLLCPVLLAAQSGLPQVSPEPIQVESVAEQFVHLRMALISLPLATALGAALALRPRRRGTPKRSSQVIQTQIILAIIGALIMLVVGASLARAFGVVGAAGLIRCAEAAMQVRGTAGEHQIDGARKAMGHAYGGGSQYFAMWIVGSEPR